MNGFIEYWTRPITQWEFALQLLFVLAIVFIVKTNLRKEMYELNNAVHIFIVKLTEKLKL
jgi:hypothetical protein